MPVIIQSGWTKGRGRYAQPQRHHGASQHQERSRSGFAICQYGVVLVRASGLRVTSRTEDLRTQVRWPASQFISAMLHPLHGVIADVSSLVGVVAGSLLRFTCGSRHFLQFLGAVFRPLRSLFCTFPSIAIQLRQKSFRGCTQGLHFSTLSAGKTGLVVLCDGHTVGRKERACPTRYGSSLTQNRARIA